MPASIITGYEDIPGTVITAEDPEDIVEDKADNQILKMPKKLAPLGKERVKNVKVNLFLEVIGILEIFLGVLVIVLNILFIYFGMHSGWYYFKDSLGTELKVISIGEGIIAGFFYIIFATVFLARLCSGGSGTKLMSILNILMVILSFTLILTNACQIGLVSWYVPKTMSAIYPEQEAKLMDKTEEQQMVVLSLQMAAHMVVMVSAVGAVVGLPKLFTTPHTFSQ
jgi:hypothetical protein